MRWEISVIESKANKEFGNYDFLIIISHLHMHHL